MSPGAAIRFRRRQALRRFRHMIRRQSIKRRSTSAEAPDVRSLAAESAVALAETPAATVPPGDEAAAHRDRLVAEFSASLDRRDDLDDESREMLLQHYREAVESAPIDLELTIPDRKQWIEMVDALKSNGLLSDEDSNNLIRSFDQAINPLQNPELRDALEFARRCRDEGEEAAFAWLETRKQAAGSEVEATVPVAAHQPPLGGITERRVRRPRGPPAR